MSKKVYHLKKATPRMKYQHMRNVLEFRADLKEKQAETMTEGTRHWMIEEIKRLSPETFHTWYDKVYALRRDGKDTEYETAIRQKYADLQSEIETAEIIAWLQPEPADKRSNPADYDTTDPLALRTSQMTNDSIAANWDAIPEIPL